MLTMSESKQGNTSQTSWSKPSLRKRLMVWGTLTIELINLSIKQSVSCWGSVALRRSFRVWCSIGIYVERIIPFHVGELLHRHKTSDNTIQAISLQLDTDSVCVSKLGSRDDVYPSPVMSLAAISVFLFGPTAQSVSTPSTACILPQAITQLLTGCMACDSVTAVHLPACLRGLQTAWLSGTLK